MDIKVDINKYEITAEKLKAMAHPHRLCILNGLLENECNVSKMVECMDLPQSTVSQHLSKLKAAGLITGTRNGLEICYKVSDGMAEKIIKVINDMINP